MLRHIHYLFKCFREEKERKKINACGITNKMIQMKTFIILFQIIVLFPFIYLISNDSTSFANQDFKYNKGKHRLSKSNSFTPQDYALLNINNLTTWQRKNGYSNHQDFLTTNRCFRGSGK